MLDKCCGPLAELSSLRRRCRTSRLQIVDVLLPVEVVSPGFLEIFNGRCRRYAKLVDHVSAHHVPCPVNAVRAVNSNELAIIVRLPDESANSVEERLHDFRVGHASNASTGALDLGVSYAAGDDALGVVIAVRVRQVDDETQVLYLLKQAFWRETPVLWKGRAYSFAKRRLERHK